MSPGCDALGIEHFECFVGDDRVAEIARRRGREHVKPAGRDDANAEREMARIDEMNAQKGISSATGAGTRGYTGLSDGRCLKGEC